MRKTRVDSGRLERACRMYKSNLEAAKALGINTSTLSRLCREQGIETPFARNKKAREEARRDAPAA